MVYNRTPTFSIIIPTYARPERLRECLRALSAIEYDPNDFEVIVVDDGSPSVPGVPCVAEVVRAFAPGLPVVCHRQANAGPAAARNAGAALARGRYLVFTDDDCAPAGDWLKRFDEQFALTPQAMLGGQVVNALPSDPFAAASQILTDYAYAASANRRCRVGGYWLFMTANLAVPSRAFRRLGGFDESFPLPAGEDYDFCHRWQHSGRPAHYVSQAAVHHSHACTLRSFVRQHFGYGRGQLQFRWRAAARSGVSRHSQILPFQLGLVRYLLMHHGRPAHWPMWWLVGLSQLVTAAGGINEILSPTKNPRSSRRGVCFADPTGTPAEGSKAADAERLSYDVV